MPDKPEPDELDKDNLPEWAGLVQVVDFPPSGLDRTVIWYRGEAAWDHGERPREIMSQLRAERTDDPALRQRFIERGLWDANGHLTEKGMLHVECFE